MAPNPHFVFVDSWGEAASVVGFRPHVPDFTVGFELSSLAIWVKDHKLREVSQARRSLEAHYGGFVLAQSKPGRRAAIELALETSYGSGPAPVRVGGCEGRCYPLGAPPDDVDGRSPAVVVWADGPRLFMVASAELEADVLLDVATSLRVVHDDE